MKFYQILILILVAALPFFPKQLDIRIVYGIFVLAILLLPLFLRKVKSQLVSRFPVTPFFLFFLLVGLASTIYSSDPKRSALGLLLFLAYFTIFTVSGSIFRDLKSKRRLAAVLICVTFLLSLVSVYNTFFLHYVNRETQGVSFFWVYFGHNHLSALLLFAIPLTFYFQEIFWPKKILRLAILLVQAFLFFSLIFTFARLSFVSLLTAFASSVVLFRLVSRKKMVAVFLTIALILTLILGGSLTQVRKFGVYKQELTNKERLIYWRQAWENFLKHPLTGSGLDTFRFVGKASEKTKQKTYYAHNFFLQMLSDTGILGFFSSLGLIFSALWLGFKRVREKWQTKEGFLLSMFWLGLLASTLNSLVDFDWQLPTVFFIFWLIAGVF